MNLDIQIMPGVRMREACGNDIEEMLVIEGAKKEDTFQTLQARMEDEKNYLTVVIEQGSGGFRNIIAWAMVRKFTSWIDWIKLFSKATGMAGYVSKAVEEVVREEGFEKIIGRCEERLVPVYKRLGYRVAGELPHFFGPGKNGYAVEKFL